MILTRQADGIRVHLVAITSEGLLATALPGVSFTATAASPDDAANVIAPVTESTQIAGLYTFLIPAAFLGANGAGVYPVVVSIDHATPLVRDHLVVSARVSQQDIDDVFDVGGTELVCTATIGASSIDTLRLAAWLERGGSPVTSGLVSASVALEHADGTVVVPDAVMTGPTARGVFRRDVSGVTLVAAQNYLTVVTITDATGAVMRYQAQPTVG